MGTIFVWYYIEPGVLMPVEGLEQVEIHFYDGEHDIINGGMAWEISAGHYTLGANRHPVYWDAMIWDEDIVLIDPDFGPVNLLYPPDEFDWQVEDNRQP